MVYVEVFRGTPVLVQVLFIFYGLPTLLGGPINALTAGIAAIVTTGVKVRKGIARRRPTARVRIRPPARAQRLRYSPAASRAVVALSTNSSSASKPSSIASDNSASTRLISSLSSMSE